MNYQNFFEVFFEKVFKWKLNPHLRFSISTVSAFLSRKRMQNYCFTTYLPNTFCSFFIRKWNFSLKSLIPRCVFQHKNIAVFPHRETAIPYYLRTRALATSKQEQSFLTPDECTPIYWQASLIFEHPKELLRPFLKTSRRLR